MWSWNNAVETRIHLKSTEDDVNAVSQVLEVYPPPGESRAATLDGGWLPYPVGKATWQEEESLS